MSCLSKHEHRSTDWQSFYLGESCSPSYDRLLRPIKARETNNLKFNYIKYNIFLITRRVALNFTQLSVMIGILRRKDKQKYKDINFMMMHILRAAAALNQALRDNRDSSAARDISGSTEELKNYPESWLESGTNWKSSWSRAGWCTNHIRPLSFLGLTNLDQLKDTCSFKNLNPIHVSDI